MGRYSDDVVLDQLYLEDEELRADERVLWGSDDDDYRQRLDRIGGRRRRVWDRIRRRKAELTAATSE